MGLKAVAGLPSIIQAVAFVASGFFSDTAPTTVVSGSATLGVTDNDIIANFAGTVTLTLPTASSNTGRSLYIKTVQAQLVNSVASNVVPLAGGAAGTAILAATAGKWVRLKSDGTNWVTMAGA